MLQDTCYEILEAWGEIDRLKEEVRQESLEITARNLLRMGMPLEDIARAAELPVEKVRSFAAVN